MLFSSISPDYARNLLDELWGCFKYVGIPLDELKRMPIKDRKYFIKKHNRDVEEENAEMKNSRNNTSSTFDIEKFTDMSQSEIENRRQ